MSRLTCHCLYVAVHCKGVSWDSRPVDGSHLLPDNCRHRLRHVSLYEVELKLAGITVEQWTQVKGHPHYSCVIEILLNPHLEEEGDRGLSKPRVSSLSFGGDDPEMRLYSTGTGEGVPGEGGRGSLGKSEGI